MQDLGSKIKAKGWRQGSILYDQDLADLQREYALGGDCNSKVGVVVSQSCDLTHHDSESEPYAELLLARIVHSRDGHFSHGKHPRRLHLEMHNFDGPVKVLEFLPWRKLVIDRERLADKAPDGEYFLLREDIRVLAVWLSQRYRRAALPDTFNALVSQITKKQNKVYTKISPCVSGIFAELLPAGEVNDKEKYSLNLLALVPRENESEIDFVQQEVARLATLFEQVGIDVQIAVQTENNVSYARVRQMFSFPLEYFSLRTATDDPMLSELED